MRLRHIPGAEERIEESPFVIHTPQEKKGHWAEVFGNDNPICLEAGIGKGKFITEMAQKNPRMNYVGVERYSSVLLKAIQKREAMEVSNLYFLCIDAGGLPEVFAEGEVSRIYLNFSDPWPKERHARRRLTSPPFMERYDRILKEDGVVEFKTDNKDLFEYSLESMVEAGWKVDWHTFDLHKSEFAEENVMTEYEVKFAALGKPICKLLASREKIK